MAAKTALIAGASIAGPALAYWLNRTGYAVTLVEFAPTLRQGGNGVDVRDQAIQVVERMGLMDIVRSHAIGDGGPEFVDAGNRRIGGIDFEAIQRRGNNAAEVRRGELARILHQATRDDVEYIFGDAIAAIEQDPSGVDVTFESGQARRFDIVIGADGFHSGVRKMIFGRSTDFVKFKQHYFAAARASTPLARARRTTIYTEPGRSVMVQVAEDGPPMCYFTFYQREPLAYHHRDGDRQREILCHAMAGMKWETPMLLKQAASDPDLYLDAQAQVIMPSWSKGRVALVGDAAHCASPFSGAGALLALVGAYRLAGELFAAGGDHVRGFAGYEAAQRPLVRSKQAHLFTGLIVPRTWLGMKIRNGLVRSSLVSRLSGIEKANIQPLPDYGI